MKLIPTKLPDVFIAEPKVFHDNRGWFMESWSTQNMEEVGLSLDFVQENHSYSKKKYTLRGLHYQSGDAAQAKLVRCIRGAVLDVAVDLRASSATYCNWVAIELSETNKKQLFIPRGFAHAFLTLTDDTEILYSVDNFYQPMAERSILWNDPDISIDWPICAPIMSPKDKESPYLKDTNAYILRESN